MEVLTVTEEQHQEDLQRLRKLCPIDDDFMRCLFKDNIPLAEFVLRIIMGQRDLVITGCETQKDMKRLAGARSICLDAYGTDANGKRYDFPKGVSEMCKVMEDMRYESLKEGLKEGRKKGLREGMKDAALRMLDAGKYAMEEIASISGLSLEEVNQLKIERKA